MELAQYADDIVLLAISKQPIFQLKYLATYLSELRLNQC